MYPITPVFNKVFLPLIAGLCLFIQMPALAGLLVSPMVADINGSRAEAVSLHVNSKSTTVQYIQIRVKRIEHPGTLQEKEVDVAATAAGVSL